MFSYVYFGFFSATMDTIIIYSEFDRFSCANTVLELKASGFICSEMGGGGGGTQYRLAFCKSETGLGF